MSVIIAWGIAVPLGIRSARRMGSLEDKVTTNTLFFLWSMPSFFAGALLLHHFCTDSSTGAAIFPHRGLESADSLWYGIFDYIIDLIWHGLMPLLVLSYASFTVLSRYMRSNLLEQLNTDYVRTARAKGASEDKIVYGHSMRNSMVTMVTLGAGLMSELFASSIIVETIFTIDGLGLLMLDAVLQQDAPLVMGSTVISVALMMVGFLIADVLYAVVDPRIRVSYA
ncbi:MAG: ABC transporter permease [Planctomycetes bacterium]|nr:ABC transporter permease [Planctomycetota bacterium]